MNQTRGDNDTKENINDVEAVQDLNHSFLWLHVRRPAGEHISQHVFGDFGAADAQSVAGVLHLPQALAQHVQLLGDLVRARVPDVGEAVVDLPQELAQLEGRVDVSVAHAADAHPHQLARQVCHAQQVVGGRHLEGQHLAPWLQGVSRALRGKHGEEEYNIKT